MIEKIAVSCLMVFISFIMIAPTVIASSAFVIAEEKARGYQYTVLKEQDMNTWEIGFRDNLSIINETRDNAKELNAFRNVVNEVDLNQSYLVVSCAYLLFIAILTLVLFFKYKQVLKRSIIVVVVFSGIGVYYALGNVMDLQSALGDANYYYMLLTN